MVLRGTSGHPAAADAIASFARERVPTSDAIAMTLGVVLMLVIHYAQCAIPSVR